MRFIKGLLFGSLVGTVTTLLLNPQSGEENQKVVKEFLEEFTDEVITAKENIENFNSSKDEVLYHVENSLMPAITGITQAFKDFQFQSEPRIKQIQEQVEVIQGHLPAESDEAQ